MHAGVKGATALSQASITGGAMSGVACLLLRRHPLDESKTLIDFDLALMLTPVLLLGVSVGKHTETTRGMPTSCVHVRKL